jgi:ech hydrogenase subunit F
MPMVPFAKSIFKNLMHRPSTRLYPYDKRRLFERTRGHIEIEIPLCIFCGLCMRKCPTQAIKVVKPEKMWSINRLRCIQCGACVEVCPKKCLYMRQAQSTPVQRQSVEEFHA